MRSAKEIKEQLDFYSGMGGGMEHMGEIADLRREYGAALDREDKAKNAALYANKGRETGITPAGAWGGEPETSAAQDAGAAEKTGYASGYGRSFPGPSALGRDASASPASGWILESAGTLSDAQAAGQGPLSAAAHRVLTGQASPREAREIAARADYPAQTASAALTNR